MGEFVKVYIRAIDVEAYIRVDGIVMIFPETKSFLISAEHNYGSGIIQVDEESYEKITDRLIMEG